MDSDDWIEPDAYRQMLELACRYQVDLVCAGRYDVSEATGKRTMGLCPEKTEVISAREMLRKIFIWEQCDSAAWDKLYRSSLFEEIRYPLDVYYEDIPTTYRLVEKAGKVCMMAQPVYNYFHRAGSITNAPLTARTFQLEAHTAAIYPYIREHYPEIEKEVRYFRVRSLMFSTMTAALAEKQARRTFRDRVRKSRTELRRHLGFLLTSPFFGRQERLTDVLLAFGLYSGLRRIYHFFK